MLQSFVHNSGNSMKTLLAIIFVLSSVSAFAEITCKAIVDDQVIYSCDFAHDVSISNGTHASISGCALEVSFSPVSETNVRIEDKDLRVIRTVESKIVFSEIIKSDGASVNGEVFLPNGTTIQCSGTNELRF
jgi:hypothetical protein